VRVLLRRADSGCRLGAGRHQEEHQMFTNDSVKAEVPASRREET
jgi:hypothetical protein